MSQYRNDPVAYAHDVLHITLWEKQIEILEGLLDPPFRVLGLSAHDVGKTHCAAVACSWWYDSRDPSVCITTAPTGEHVKDVLWKEVRMQRTRAGLGHFGSYLKSSPDHYAKGFTTKGGESFQGRHDLEMLFVVDESIGVDEIFWTVIKTMFQPNGQHGWLAIGNPTDTTTQAYIESQEVDRAGNPRWKVINISGLDHPNIRAELAGQKAPYPAAISLAQLDEGLEGNCSVVTGDPEATDIEWPPGSGRYLHPGPVAEARWLGRWPSQGTYGVWNEALWLAALRPAVEPLDVLPEIGCDTARYGDDFTSIVWRRGAVALGHETYNGWGHVQIARRLMQIGGMLAEKCSAECPQRAPVKPTDISIKVGFGAGQGTIDILAAAGYKVYPVNEASEAYQSRHYPNKRSELWFYTAERARIEQVSLARLPTRTLNELLRRQAMGPTWKMNLAGQKVVEPKEETKKRLKRSPDDMDALNLAYFESPGLVIQKSEDKETNAVFRRGLLGLGDRESYDRSAASRRGMYGR